MVEWEEQVQAKLRRYKGILLQYRARRELYEQTYPTTTLIYHDMPKPPQEEHQADRIADERWEMSQEIKQLLGQLQEELIEIMRMVRGIEPIDEAVIIRRYMLGQTFEQIAEIIPCDRATVYRWHRRGIREIADKMRRFATVCDNKGVYTGSV